MPIVDSFKKFDYGLRPCKQIERKILIEKFRQLSECGYNVSDYRYVGFGSVYYVDFIMFHKYLGIQNMDCVEHSTNKKRMRFNKPYRFITLRLRPYSEAVTSIRKTIPYLVWLDYDYPITASMLQDIDNTLIRLQRKSIFLVTVDGRPHLPNDHDDYEMWRALDEVQQNAYMVDYYQNLFGQWVPDGHVTLNNLDENELPMLLWNAITNRITETLAHRADNVQYIQLFNYSYADGSPLHTFGGLIGNNDDLQSLEQNHFFDEAFLSRNHLPVEIAVPPLTHREKLWLDSNMKTELEVANLAFELEPEFLANYRKYYRQYPTFIESIV